MKNLHLLRHRLFLDFDAGKLQVFDLCENLPPQYRFLFKAKINLN